MEEKQLESLEKWFFNHVRKFDGGDAETELHMRLKEEHTSRVVAAASELSAQMGWNTEECRLARAAALLHDVGRFSQYSIYHTFNDPSSINHALLGIRVLQEEAVWSLAGVKESDALKLERVILYHNLRELPENEEADVLKQSRLLRDADKLDIYHLIATETMPPSKELQDAKSCSAAVCQTILAGRMAQRSDVMTSLDQLLFRLSWVYDINYPATLGRLVGRGLWQKLSEQVPDQPEAKKVLEHLQQYVMKRVRQQAC